MRAGVFLLVFFFLLHLKKGLKGDEGGGGAGGKKGNAGKSFRAAGQWWPSRSLGRAVLP